MRKFSKYNFKVDMDMAWKVKEGRTNVHPFPKGVKDGGLPPLKSILMIQLRPGE